MVYTEFLKKMKKEKRCSAITVKRACCSQKRSAVLSVYLGLCCSRRSQM